MRALQTLEPLFEGNLQKVAKAYTHALFSQHPRERYLVGMWAYPLAFLERVLPVTALDDLWLLSSPRIVPRSGHKHRPLAAKIRTFMSKSKTEKD